MCRISAYIGHFPVVMSRILDKPDNSLIQQSISCREDSLIKVNADGFGVGWYNDDISKIPAVFKSTQPAWNDLNLRDLGGMVQSKCFLAHIRASKVGHVSYDNCHPFRYNEFLCVHNGIIHGFERIRFHVQRVLPRSILNHIRGQTDSEYFFLLMMFYYHRLSDKKSVLERLASSFDLALKQIICFLDAVGVYDHRSTINVVITNGRELFASRFGSWRRGRKYNKTLRWLQGDSIEFSGKNFRVSSRLKRPKFTMVASEKIVTDEPAWQMVPENHFFLLNANHGYRLVSI